MASKKKPSAAPKRSRTPSKAADAAAKPGAKAPAGAPSGPPPPSPPSPDNAATKPEPIYNEPIEFVLPRGVDRAQAARTRAGGRATVAALPEGLHRGEVIHALRFGSTSRGAGGALGTQRAVAVPGRDLVALHLGQGLKLYLHPQTAAEVLQPGALAAGKRGGGPGRRSVAINAHVPAP